jgi:hypothetical protein
MENAFIVTRGNFLEGALFIGFSAECRILKLLFSERKYIFPNTPCILGKAYAIAADTWLRTEVKPGLMLRLGNATTG